MHISTETLTAIIDLQAMAIRKAQVVIELQEAEIERLAAALLLPR